MSLRVVLDTNVLLDLWVFDDPRVETLRRALDAGECTALRSATTDAELAAVLARPQFAVSAERQRALLTAWQARAHLVEPVFPAAWTCNDPHDQPFLDLAATAGADALVTKDKALLRIARKAGPAGLRIVNPGEALALPVAQDRPIHVNT